MARRPYNSSKGSSASFKAAPGLPSREQVLAFIQSADSVVGKREIAKHFRLKGQEKIALKKLLRDMAEEGLIDGKKTAYHRMGGVPRVTVLKVVDIEDGEPIAVPETWNPDSGSAPPRLRIMERQKGKTRHAALRIGDRVLARTQEVGSGWQAHVMKKLPARTEGLMGVVDIDGAGQAWLMPTDKRVRYSSMIKELGEAQEGDLVLAERLGHSPRSGVKVVEVLGDPFAPRSFSLIAISKFGIPHVFPQEALDEAEQAAALPLAEDKREDLRDLPIIAIDPADARDHDDAIWAKPDGRGGFDAIVAIADVSFYVRPGTQLDREARKRSNSVYFPDRVVPMLPETLSADMCSLKQGEERAAMVCHLHISADGQVSRFSFTRALVKLAQNIAYEDAQAQIDAGTAPPYMRDLWDCWALLAEARAKRDPLALELPERRVMLDEQGQIAEVAVRERLDAHRLVEDFMIAANVAAAKALEAKKAPVVYRVHEPPSREKLIALKDYLASFGRKLAMGQVITPGLFNAMLASVEDESEREQVMEAVLRSQTQAYYGPKNAGHFGLALGSYAHFTSPIRRYADLLVHRSLVNAYGLEQGAPHNGLPARTGLADSEGADLVRICDLISQNERRAMEAERDTVDRYVAAWLSGRVGQTFDTRITGVQSFGFFATIDGLGGDGLVPVSTLGQEHFAYDDKAQVLIGEDSGTRYGAGDRLKLDLAEANPLTGALKFLVPGSEGEAIDRRGRPGSARRRSGGQGRNAGTGRGGPGGVSGKKDKKGKHRVGKRGRPGNIRHQGRRK